MAKDQKKTLRRNSRKHRKKIGREEFVEAKGGESFLKDAVVIAVRWHRDFTSAHPQSCLLGLAIKMSSVTQAR